MKILKVLVACEESQTVCKAFRDLGHEAYSNDIIECSGGHPEWHLQMDAIDAINLKKWDLVIAHPPCTHLAVSGARVFEAKRKDGRQQQGIDFFMSIVYACEEINVPYMIENPVGVMSTIWRKPDQVIQPWQFGDEAQKRTCLWVSKLPKLKSTKIVDKGDFTIYRSGVRMPAWYSSCPGNSKKRSKTFQGIATAMAEQLSKYIILNESDPNKHSR